MPEVAEQYASGEGGMGHPIKVVMQYGSPNGHRGIVKQGREIAQHGDGEVIIPKGSTYSVTSKEWDGDRLTVKLSPIGKSKIGSLSTSKAAEHGITVTKSKVGGYRIEQGGKRLMFVSSKEEANSWLDSYLTDNVSYTLEGVDNVFCPTGPGGGIDPTCSAGGVPSFYGSKASENEKIIKDLQALAKSGDISALKAHPGTPSPKVQDYKQKLIDAMSASKTMPSLKGTVEKQLPGGSKTPPSLVKADDGTMLVVKTGNEPSLLNEVDADNAYRAAGFAVPDSGIVEWNGNLAKSAETI